MGIHRSKEHCLNIAKFLRRAKKRAVKTALFEYFIGLGLLHSHSFDANTQLFNFFTANFTAESTQIESKQKGDFD